MSSSRGFSLAEILVVLAIVGAAAAITLPSAALFRDGGKAMAGARAMAVALSDQRWKAVAARRAHGLFFEQLPGGWAWREVEDGNGNGIRTAEVRNGTDRTAVPPRRLDAWIPGVRIGVPAGGPYPEAPPGTGVLHEGDDPVRFGAADIASFTPLGQSSSGTLYVTDGRSGLCAVVLFGPSARTRVWRWVAGEGKWTR